MSSRPGTNSTSGRSGDDVSQFNQVTSTPSLT